MTQTLSLVGTSSKTSSNADGVATGDFNGDGKPDLVVAAHGINILLGAGGGTFTPASGSPLSAGTTPVDVAVGDFNSDGKADLAVVNNGSGTVSIFLGNGDGTFGAPVSYSAGSKPNAITTGDFNGDGNLDLAITNQNANTVTILLGSATGVFAPSLSSPIAAGATPYKVVAADFNGDGNVDLAITNSGTTTVTVLLGDGTGGFSQAPGSPLTTPKSPTGVVVGDFNQDGTPDLAVVSSNNNTVGIYLGAGDGSFTVQNTYSVGQSPIAVSIGDFNQDRNVDLAVVNNNSNYISVLLGKGDANGSFLAASSYAVGSNGLAIAVANWDGDGLPDIAVPVQGNNVSILLDQITQTATASLSGVAIPGAATPHNVDASYPGNSSFSASTSSTLSLTGTPITTTTLLSANPSSSSYGNQVVFSATLSPWSLGNYSTNNEQITFKNGATTLGTGQLTSGVATINVTSLPIGTNNITASFAADSNFAASNSSRLSYTVQKTTPAVTWATPAAITYGTLLSATQLNATASVPGTFSYNPALQTLLPAGIYTLTATFTPTDAANYTTATASVTLVVNQVSPVITWGTPAPVPFGTPLSAVQLNATVTSTTLVPLSSYYNVSGIFTSGTAVTNGGFDANGSAYTSNSLGTSLVWNGVTYPLGPVNAPDAVSNETINLPQGYFASLVMLGALVNNATAANTFTVTYTDGTTATVTQSLSDWVYPKNFTGESSVKCNVSRDQSNGSQDPHSTCVFAYQIPLNSSKIVQSVTLPNTGNVVMLAMGLTTPPVSGNLVYSPAAGTIPATGTDTLSVSFTPTDTANYLPSSANVQLVVNPATSYIAWPTPAPVIYGTPLSSTQLNAVAETAVGVTPVPLSAYYRVNSFFSDGSSFLTAGFDGNGNAYSANLLGTSIIWNGITFALGSAGVPDGVTSTTIALPSGNFSTLSLIGAATTSGQTNQTFTISYTDGTTSSVQQSMSNWAQSSSYSGETTVSTMTYLNTFSGGMTTQNVYLYGYQIPINSAKTVQSVTLPNNLNVVFLGMALSSSSSSLNTIPGTYVYTPPSGTVLPAGTSTLSVTFTPNDTTNYVGMSKTVPIVVSKQALAVTANSQSIGYGGTAAPYSASITGFVNGDTQASSITGSPSLTTTPAIPAAPGTYPIVVTAGSLSSTNNYSFTFFNGTLTITRATPTVTWATPSAIVYGTALSNTQLNATASVPGTFAYTPAAGSIPAAGTDTLSVTFTPTDSNDFAPVTKTVQIVVNQVTPTVTWATPAPVTYGIALSATQLNATASVPGTFVYTPAAGGIPATGIDTLSVTFTPTDSIDYASVTKTVQLVVNQASPTVTWSNPAAITYGTSLSATQLNATASVPGTFAYSPAAGTTPLAGTDMLSVTFTPTDSTDYATVTKTVQLVVNQSTPTVTWSNPAAIIYGTALSATQLNATASVPGTFVYTPAAGSVPATGTDTLSVTFTPTDGTNYSTVPKTVQLVVNQAAPLITWSNPSPITYGTALSSTQLNATASSPGTLVYAPAAGSVPATGTNTLSVTFTPSDATNYSTASKTVQLVVNQAVPVLTWSDPSPIIYGTALSSTQLNATASVPGTFVYTPAAGSVPATGADTLSVTFTPTDTTNYSTATKTVQLMVGKATPTIAWAIPSAITYGTALSAVQLNATASVPGTFIYTPAAGSVLPTGTDTLSVTFTPTDATDYSTTTKTVQLVVNQAAPTVTWATPAAVTYGTALSGTQLNASASVPGTFVYTPAVGSVPATGTDTLSVTFNPADTTNYTPVTKTVQLVVNQAAPAVTWSTPAAITYGTALSAAQLNATASVPGTFVYTPTAGTVPATGADTLSVTFTPTDSTDYATITKTVQLTVNQATPVITWSNPAAITYGTALSATQLNATASVPGTLVYTPTLGDVLPAGTNTLSVTFTPTDSANYSTISKTVHLVVNQASPTLTWSNPASITYGTALSSTQLNATASVPGTFVYTPAAGSVPLAGTDALSVTFTPTDNTNYSAVSKTVQLLVNQAAPVITWSNPAAISYGTALSATQLNATASVPGTFVYTPAAGSVPSAGTDTLSVTFTPTDTANYSTTTKTVQLVVNQAVPVISWSNPAPITYGTSLSASQLNATASVPGTFVYTPAAGSIPATGTDTLSVTFTPTDTTSYTSVTTTVQLVVNQAAPTITWSSPAPITYGTALSSAQLNATASVPGTFVYTPAAGSVPATGTDTLSVTFTPTDATNYTPVTKTVQVVVNQATPTVTWSTPTAITYGTALSAIQLNATASVPGTFVYTPAAGSTPATGTDTLSVSFTPTDKTDYATVTKTVQLTVNQGVPTITWATPSSITYGTTLSSAQLNATASVPGSFVYTPAAGTTPNAGVDTLSVTFTPTDTTNYSTATKTVQLTVTQDTPGITWSTPAPITYGTALSNIQLDATTSEQGTLTYTPAAGTILPAGSNLLSVTFVPTDTTNHSTATATVSLIVNQATPIVTWTTPATIPYGTALSAAQLNATASVPGAFAYTPVPGSIPSAGTNTLSVTFTPTDSTNYSTVTKTVTLTVNQAAPTVTWINPSAVTYGTALSATQLDATASVPGAFVYTPAAGSIPSAGTDTLSVTFTPTDTTNYSTVTKTVTLTVNQATATVTWATPSSVTYGTALSSTQLDATASVPGSFVYTPASGAVLNAGTNTLSVTFTPTDLTNYASVTKTVQLMVNQAVPTVTWSNPASISYGTALSSTQLDATASVPGSFVYTPAASTVPSAGIDVLSVAFTPTDTTNYAAVTKTVSLVVSQGAATITWATPAAITYGTALSDAQLNATASIPGVFVYTPAAGTVPSAGTVTLSATFMPTDTTNYPTVSKTVSLAVNQAVPTLTWAAPAPITYGTALSSTQLNATASVPGTFTYTPAAGSVPSVGTDTLSVTFTPTDATKYSTVTKTVSLIVSQGTATITWATPTPITYGTALSNSQLNATSSVPGAFVYTPAAGTIPSAGTDTLSVAFTPTDTANYPTVTKTVSLVVNQAVPTLTWAVPASITYGTALSATQLNATASVPGTFVYTPDAGSIPAAGTDTLSVTFTPTDSTNYSSVTKTVQIVVNQGIATVTWATPMAITYGTALSATQLNATASVPGTFAYTPAAGSVPPAGTDILSVTFTPTDGTNYSTVTKTVQLVVNQAAPVIAWSNPAPIAYGTPLSATQLNATASVPGTFVYSPAAGSMPAPGTDTLSVTFTPTDTTNYSTVTKTVQLVVNQTAPLITWANPASITYGTALSSTQLNATASVPGTFVYTPAAGSVLATGTDTLSVTFTPTDSTYYSPATKTVQIVVSQAAPVITWSNPVAITYGTALSATQLNATASVPGTFVYAPTAGSISPTGTDTLSVTFTPTDTTNYSPVTKTVQIVVNQAAPTVNWATPAPITYGTTLSAVQLNATASVPGAFVYTPVSGIVPAVGIDTLSVTFTPTDTTNYSTVTKTVQLVVNQSTPVITWSNPAAITYGTALSSAQLDATASVPGMFAYTPAAGSALATGTDTLSVTFTPTDSTSYSTATKTVQIVVNQAAPTVTWGAPAAITYGTALSATQLNATASVPGTFVYTPAVGDVPSAGAQTLTVVFTPADTTNFSSVTKTVQLVVSQATPVVSWSDPAAITYGTALSSTQLDATASVPGTFLYTPAAGSIPSAGHDSLSVTFTPTDTSNYSTVTKAVQIDVEQAAPIVTWSSPAAITYGTALSSTQLNATASVPGTFVYTPAAGTVLGSGNETLSVVFTPTDATDYSAVTKTVSLTVDQATPKITWAAPASITYGTALSATQLDANASVPGTFAYSPAAGSILSAGLNTLSVTFTPTDSVNYTTLTKSIQLTIGEATPTITWANPAAITYGTPLSATQLNATASVPGTFLYTPALGSILPAGENTLSVTFTPSDTVDYTTVTKTVQLSVGQATPILTWAKPATITYGTALGAAQLNAVAEQSNGTPIPGIFSYSPASGSVLSVGTQTLSVTFTPTDTADFSPATKTVPLTVSQATLTVAANNFTRLYGTQNPVFTGSVTGAQNGDVFSESFSTQAGISSQAGQYSIVPSVAGSNLSDYSQVVQNGTLTISKAPVVITTSLSTGSITVGLNVTMTATVASTTTGVPTGTITFLDNGNSLGSGTLSNGVASFSTSALQIGKHVITAAYRGDVNFAAGTTSGASGATTITINPMDFTLEVTSPATVEGIFGTTRKFTFHIAPTGAAYPADIQFAASQTGPLLSTYTFSPATVGKNSGASDITLTIETRKLASLDSSQDLTNKLSRIVLGLFIVPLVGLRYSRQSKRRLMRVINFMLLAALSLGCVETMTGCGSGYVDHVYPITVTASGGGVQHSVTVNFHINQSSQ
jgi:hypothetical protein